MKAAGEASFFISTDWTADTSVKAEMCCSLQKCLILQSNPLAQEVTFNSKYFGVFSLQGTNSEATKQENWHCFLWAAYDIVSMSQDCTNVLIQAVPLEFRNKTIKAFLGSDHQSEKQKL